MYPPTALRKILCGDSNPMPLDVQFCKDPLHHRAALQTNPLIVEHLIAFGYCLWQQSLELDACFRKLVSFDITNEIIFNSNNYFWC